MTVDQKQTLGAVWREPDVARLYRYRPAYPAPVFDILRRLIVEPRTVLDAGSGTGGLARQMTTFAARIDAVEPSAAMIEEARRLPGGRDPRIDWILGPAETAPFRPPYGLITTGQSLHWMDHEVVMPRFRDALAPEGFLAATDIDWDYPPTWRDRLIAIFERYSPVNSKRYVTDLFGDLAARGLFERAGSARTSLVPVDLSVDEFINALQSTSSLSRVSLRERTGAFGDEVRALFADIGLDRARFAVFGNVVWGRPL